MNKRIKALLLPVSAGIILSGCGGTAENVSGNYYQTGITAFAPQTESRETTALTTCTTLKPFADMTSMTKLKFSEITRLEIRDKIIGGEIVPWDEKSTAAESH